MPTIYPGRLLSPSKHFTMAFPLNRDHCYKFYSARYALSAAIDQLRIRPYDNVLLPSYNCGLEIEPFLRQKIGVNFYDVFQNTCIDIDDLYKRIDNRTKAVLVTHYFGFPQFLDKIQDICKQQRIYLIEDCAHSFLSKKDDSHLGEIGDISIFSLRKSLPAPDGGILLINNQNLFQNITTKICKPNFFSTIFRSAELFKDRPFFQKRGYIYNRGSQMIRMMIYIYITGARLLCKAINKYTNYFSTALVHPASRNFYSLVQQWNISFLTEKILHSCDFQDIYRRRRKNYLFLLKWFGEKQPQLPLFDELPAGCCPLNFPIILNNRNLVNTEMRRQGIGTWNWWAAFHDEVPWKQFPHPSRLKKQVLILPIHQDLDNYHLDTMVRVFERTLGSIKL